MSTTYCPLCGGTGWRKPTGWHLMRYCTNCETGRALQARNAPYERPDRAVFEQERKRVAAQNILAALKGN